MVDYPVEKVFELKDVKKPAEVKLLRTGEKLDYTFENGNLKIVLPVEKATTLVDVVAVTW